MAADRMAGDRMAEDRTAADPAVEHSVAGCLAAGRLEDWPVLEAQPGLEARHGLGVFPEPESGTAPPSRRWSAALMVMSTGTVFRITSF